MSSILQISVPNSSLSISFVVTFAEVYESFDSILKIECEAYYEGLQDYLKEVLDKIEDFFYAKLILVSPLSTKRIATNQQEFSCVGIKFSFLQKSELQDKSLNQKFFFSFVLSSPLYLLKMNVSSRIFYKKSIIDIVISLLSSYLPILQREVDLSFLQGVYHQNEYFTQYKESDLDFIQRICFNAGIFIFERENRIYLCDNPILWHQENTNTGLETLVNKYQFDFNTNPNNPLTQEAFYHLTFSSQINCKFNFNSSFHPGSPTLLKNQDSLFLYPKASNSKVPSFSSLKHSAGFNLTQIDMEEATMHLESLRKQMQDYIFEIESNIIDLRLGDEVIIRGISKTFLPDFMKDKEEKYKIIGITHHFKDQANIKSSDKATSSYSNSLKLLPSSIPFFTHLLDKPIISGGLLGVVVGEDMEDVLSSIKEQKNTIHTDSQGRIRVIFAYSLAQVSLDKKRFKDNALAYQQSFSTCYLRVLSPIASENGGFFALPRVGDEVLIGFLEGDCDKPVILGGFYNDTSYAPYSVAEGYHYTALSASSVGSSNTNKRSEIIFKTQDNKEEIYLFSQKDYRTVIANDYYQKVGHNKTLTISGTNTQNITFANIQNIGGLQNINVGAQSIENIALSKDLQIGGSYSLNIGGEYRLRVAAEVTEMIGENKDVVIQKNLTKRIYGDKQEEIDGNKTEIIYGECHLQANQCIDLDSKLQMHIRAKENLDIQSENFSIINNNSTSIETKTLGIYSKDCSIIEDDKEIAFKVAEGLIQIRDNEVIIKAGGVEVSIGKDGLVVRGGEIKSE